MSTEENIKRIMDKITRQLNSGKRSPYVYTYPTKKAYHPFTNSEKIAESWKGVKGSINLYIHLPFCQMKCSFCNLFTIRNNSTPIVELYVESLKKEIELISKFLERESLSIRSLYLGGGTPTILSLKQASGLMDHIHNRFRLDFNPEVTIEAAPNSIDPMKCHGLREMGFNRISIGVQTFNEGELKVMGRYYGADLGRQAAKDAIEAGFPNVNIDLIYGVPGQTWDSWIQNLEIAVQLGVTTLTLYPIAVRKHTLFRKIYQTSPWKFPENSTLYEWYDFACDFLESKGYTQHTLVTFVRDGGGCRHEANEFIGIPTIGIGAGARSYAPSIHYTNDDYFHHIKESVILENYIEGIKSGNLLIRSAVLLETDDIICRFVILSLLYEGINREEYFKKFGEQIEKRFGCVIEALRLSGFIENCGCTVKLTKKGMRISGLVAEVVADEMIKAGNCQ